MVKARLNGPAWAQIFWTAVLLGALAFFAVGCRCGSGIRGHADLRDGIFEFGDPQWQAWPAEQPEASDE